MSGCDALLRRDDSGGRMDCMQNGIDGKTFPRCFDAMKEDGWGAGKSGL